MTQTINETLDKGGATSLIGGTILWIAEKVNLINVNDLLTGISLILGIIWMVFKIRNEILTSKIKQNEIKKHD